MRQAEKKAYRPEGNGAQTLPARALQGAGKNAYPTCAGFACTRKRTGKNACRYLCDFRRNVPEGGRWGKKSVFYETKPTSLLEST